MVAWHGVRACLRAGLWCEVVGQWQAGCGAVGTVSWKPSCWCLSRMGAAGHQATTRVCDGCCSDGLGCTQ